MISLLHCIGAWISRWQQPVVAFWPCVVASPSAARPHPLVDSTRLDSTRPSLADSPASRTRSSPRTLSAFRKSFLASLYAVLPPRFAPSLQTFLRTLLAYPSPSFAFPPAFPRALPTLVTLLDRYDPLLFALVYEDIERKVVSDARGRFGDKRLEGLLRWLSGAGDGWDTGVMGWIGGIYEGAAGEAGGTTGGHDDARKFLKPTLSRFEYHVHKVLCQLRCAASLPAVLEPH